MVLGVSGILVPGGSVLSAAGSQERELSPSRRDGGGGTISSCGVTSDPLERGTTLASVGLPQVPKTRSLEKVAECVASEGTRVRLLAAPCECGLCTKLFFCQCRNSIWLWGFFGVHVAPEKVVGSWIVGVLESHLAPAGRQLLHTEPSPTLPANASTKCRQVVCNCRCLCRTILCPRMYLLSQA